MHLLYTSQIPYIQLAYISHTPNVHYTTSQHNQICIQINSPLILAYESYTTPRVWWNVWQTSYAVHRVRYDMYAEMHEMYAELHKSMSWLTCLLLYDMLLYYITCIVCRTSYTVHHIPYIVCRYAFIVHRISCIVWHVYIMPYIVWCLYNYINVMPYIIWSPIVIRT